MNVMRHRLAVEDHELLQLRRHVIDGLDLLIGLFDLEHDLKCHLTDLHQILLIVL